MALAKRATTETLSADGSVFGIEVRGKVAIQVTGAFGGGTVAVEGSLDGTDYSTINSTTFSGAGVALVEWYGFIRLTISSSTDPDVDVTILVV